VLAPAEVLGLWSAPEVQLPDPLATLETRYQGARPLEDAHLPQTLHPDSARDLVLLWEITDCDSLDPASVPELVVRNALGATESVPLDTFMGPANSPEWLIELGLCDAVPSASSTLLD